MEAEKEGAVKLLIRENRDVCVEIWFSQADDGHVVEAAHKTDGEAAEKQQHDH